MTTDKTSHLHKDVYSIIIILPRLRRIKRNIPTYPETRLEVEAAGSRNRHVGLVKIDSAAVVGEALLKIKARVEARGAAVIEKRIADELLGVEART